MYAHQVKSVTQPSASWVSTMMAIDKSVVVDYRASSRRASLVSKPVVVNRRLVYIAKESFYGCVYTVRAAKQTYYVVL